MRGAYSLHPRQATACAPNDETRALLSRLVARARGGEGIVTARGTRRFGALHGKLTVDEAFFDPPPEAELARWE
jgi:hypothetical protein